MRLDFGFAPNPFYGVCTLATCKPRIRAKAEIGDWVVGTGSAEHHLTGRLVYAQRVDEILSFDEYWADPRFRAKRPNLRGSLKQAFGDNIYHSDDDGAWHQANSHHSLADGSPNADNIARDTQAPRVLISDQFVYFGGEGPEIPAGFRDYGDDHIDVCAVRGHRCVFPQDLVEEFVAWIRSLGVDGYVAEPDKWVKGKAETR